MMNLKKKTKEKKGFTLVELIVVIVIIAILAMIAIPAVSKYVSKANDSKEAGNMAVVKSAASAAVANVAGTSGAISKYDDVTKELQDTLGTDSKDPKVSNTGKNFTVTFKDGTTVTFTVSGTAITNVN